ncbi:hypothetical protein CsSME_00045143 [Camellia sinensis var. sinensis]
MKARGKPEKQKHTVTIDEMVGGRKESILWTSRLIHCTHASCPRYTMVPASLYLGFSASIKWVAEGTYLTSTARSLAHDLNLEEGNVIGNFNGEFWGMFAGHQFVGNLMSLFLLKDGTGVTTSGSGTTLLYIVFVCSRTLGTILMCFLQKRDAKGEETLPDSSG